MASLESEKHLVKRYHLFQFKFYFFIKLITVSLILSLITLKSSLFLNADFTLNFSPFFNKSQDNLFSFV